MKEHGPQPSSRRHAHGTNRYNKNGFMPATSQSSYGNDSDAENIPNSDEISKIIELDENGQPATIADNNDITESQQLLPNDVISPRNNNGQQISNNFEYDEYQMDQKTIEQHNLRQLSQKYSKRRNEI